MYFKELGVGSPLGPLFHLTIFFTIKFAQRSFLQHAAIGSWNPNVGRVNTVLLWYFCWIAVRYLNVNVMHWPDMQHSENIFHSPQYLR